jgi:hypothetical protein
MDISINIAPRRIEDFIFEIEVIAERADDLSPAFEEIAGKLLNRERRMFETHGASSGRYWAPLKPTTIKSKRAEGRPYPARPLWASGELMRSLSERGARYQILDISEDSFVFGTTHPSAEFHESGTRHMPRRPPVVIPAKHAKEYINDIKDWIFHGEA